MAARRKDSVTRPRQTVAELDQQLAESRAEQAATAEILAIINRASGDATPVFDAILERAMRLCDAAFGGLLVPDGEFIRYVALGSNTPKRFADFLAANRVRLTSSLGPAYRDRVVFHVADVKKTEGYRRRTSVTVVAVDQGGVRTALLVPLLKDDTFIGAFTLYRQEVRPFAERQIAIAQSFAAQAAIAMENARLLTETREALEKQTATAEILRVISASPTDLQPTLDAIATRAMRLTGAVTSVVFQFDGALIHFCASDGMTDAENNEVRAVFPLPPSRASATTRAIQTRDIVHIHDPAADPDFSQASLIGYGTILSVPMLHDGKPLGAVTVTRQRVEPFAPAQIDLLKTFADQAVIAIENVRLFGELRLRTEELAVRNSAYGERIEHQAATIDVLKAMSGSPGDPQPVFDLITARALSICNAAGAVLVTFDGRLVHLQAMKIEEAAEPGVAEAYRRLYPAPPSRASVTLRAILEGRVIHVTNMAEDPDLAQAAQNIARRGVAAVPLLRDGAVIGAISISAKDTGGLSASQVELLQTFAEQAVIAITSAETYRALQQRTGDLQESLEHQTATSDVLKVINASPGDLAPVFEAMLDKALRLCEASLGALCYYDGGTFRMAAQSGASAEAVEALRTIVPEPGTGMAQIVEGAGVIQVADAGDTDAYRSGAASRRKFVDLTGARTALWLALRKDDALLGVLVIYRREVRPFSDKHVALLQNFADQAVIAMENARLMAETREALEKQTATAEILRVISASPTELQPTFDAIAARAARLTGAAGGHVFTYDGTLIHHRAQYGGTEAGLAAIRAVFPVAPSRGSSICRAIMTREISHIVDPKLDPEFAHVELTEYGTALSVPMLRDGKALGGISVIRQRVEPFTPAQIDLLKTFADQAVIAIENVRLFTELRLRTADLQESLTYQTAISDVLKVISRSTFDLQPVLDTLIQTAARLCNADGGGLTVREGDGLRYMAVHGLSHEMGAVIRRQAYPLTRGSIAGRTALEGKVVHFEDIVTDPEYTDRQVTVFKEVRSALGVPMMRDGEVIGTIGLTRNRVEPFTERQIELIRTFADQAVIAIENARLLTELRERTADLQQSLEYQTATADVLKVISRSTFDLQPVLDTLLQTAARLCNSDGGGLTIREDDGFRYLSIHGVSNEFAAAVQQRAYPPSRDSIAGRTALEGRVVQIADFSTDPEYADRQVQNLKEVRSALGVPILRDSEVVGTFTLTRNRVEPFTERQIELVRTFADQAVIAIENARLLGELRDSLDRQTATAEILRAIAATPGDPTRALDAIAETSVRLFGASRARLSLLENGALVQVAMAGENAATVEAAQQAGPELVRVMNDEILNSIVFRENRQLHAPDLDHLDPSIGDWKTAELARRSGTRAVVLTPLTREGRAIGVLICTRDELKPFAEAELALLTNFADQAVIAIENARLLTELRESLEQQQAIAEVLRVINASPGNLAPVYEAILDKAHSLCGATKGSLLLLDDDGVHSVAARGQIPFAMGQRFLPGPNNPIRRLVTGESFVQIADLRESDDPIVRAGAAGGTRTLVIVPLRKEDTLLGFIAAAREEVRPFTDKQIALLQSFAAQAVIAMDNARLLGEIRQRQAELRVTFENMGDAVIMFDGAQRLVAWNRNFQTMLDIPEEWLAAPQTYNSFAQYLTDRGEFGDTPPPDIGAPERGEVRPIRYERTRPDGRVLEVRRNPIPGGGGFVFIYADITERKRAEESILAAREAAEKALADLKLAQANLIQAEKMASLGALTAGIAHEIKNPLNFVNNFANLSNELLGELKETAAPAFATLDAGKRDEIDETMDMLTGNLEKIQEHGRRADGIVKSMLAHSRGGSGDRREADVNALVEESLNLAYHGARAQDQNFNITLERDYDKGIEPIELVPQDVTRVFLNLCGNGFYAANKRRKDGGDEAFRPVLKVATRELGNAVEVRIRDNGTGIPPEVRDKLFQPFFTTKPTGEGTGLGLSISYDIVTQQHGGTIAVDSRVGDFTEFTIRLPRNR